MSHLPDLLSAPLQEPGRGLLDLQAAPAALAALASPHLAPLPGQFPPQQALSCALEHPDGLPAVAARGAAQMLAAQQIPAELTTGSSELGPHLTAAPLGAGHCLLTAPAACSLPPSAQAAWHSSHQLQLRPVPLLGCQAICQQRDVWGCSLPWAGGPQTLALGAGLTWQQAGGL